MALASNRPQLRICVGIEGTFEPFSQRDTLVASGHFKAEQWRRDFELIQRLGVTDVRYPIPWHRIEANEGRYDWREQDPIITAAHEEFGLNLIADPLHHTSYPRWLRAGFLDDRFLRSYVNFVTTLAERFPQLRMFTPSTNRPALSTSAGFEVFGIPTRVETRPTS